MLEGHLRKNRLGHWDVMLNNKRVGSYFTYKKAKDCLDMLNFNLKIDNYIQHNIVTLGLSLRKRFGLSRREALQYTLEVIQEMV